MSWAGNCPAYIHGGAMLILEDGTGIVDANTYISIADAENYLLGDRLSQFQALTQDKQEEVLINGTQLVDITYDWFGMRKTAEQGLSWPRIEVEKDGFPIEGVPIAVKKASCEAAFIAMTSDGLYSNENDWEISNERIGDISVTYASGVKNGRPVVSKYEILDKMLKGLYRTDTVGGASIGIANVVRA